MYMQPTKGVRIGSEDLPRYAMGRGVNIAVDVEHESGVWEVKARFQHEEWDGVVIECRGFARPGLFGRYPRRARVMLRSESPTSDRNAGRYRLDHLQVFGRGLKPRVVHPTSKLGFYVEERTGLPDHETNVRRYKRGEEVVLEVEASRHDGVGTVEILASGGYGPGEQRVFLRGKGSGSKKERVRLKGRIGNSQATGRYRARRMKVFPSARTAVGLPRDRPPLPSQPELNPPLVFEVVRNPDLPGEEAQEKPSSRNWGFPDDEPEIGSPRAVD